jgi:uncharacterized Ntn-hydrolase superfamily protein
MARRETPGTASRSRRGTYSIVARDAATGELGVAVQSHWFSVGPLVPWAMPGVGAVATQANVEAAYGPRLLALLADGHDAPAALARLVAADSGAAGRQVAVVDSTGHVAAHTGNECMPHAGHIVDDGVSCQANIMANPTVWGAMMAAYTAGSSPLRDRLLAALDAAEAAGGDIRGRQSAAILVVPAHGESWESEVSLRVEDHPEPLVELRRLCTLHDAYVLAGDGDAMANEHRYEEAAALYRQAAELAPESAELRFWSGLGTVQLGDLHGGVRQIDGVITQFPGWGELLARLPANIMPSVTAARSALGIQTAFGHTTPPAPT